jgi:hypothetical protein
MISKIPLEFYLLEFLCVDGLDFVPHKCNVNTFETSDPSKHGILGKKIHVTVMVSSLESFLSMHCGEMYVKFNSILKSCLISCVLIQGILIMN